MKTYKVGDRVWYATFGNREVQVLCPVCYGNKSVFVTLGNGDEVKVECQYCQLGFKAPKGFVTEYQHIPAAELLTIERCKVEQTFDGDVIEYTGGNFLLWPDRMFDTEEAAMTCAKEIAEKFEQERLSKPKFKNEKSYAWNASYHIKQAQLKRKEAQYHEEKAVICKNKSNREK